MTFGKSQYIVIYMIIVVVLERGVNSVYTLGLGAKKLELERNKVSGLGAKIPNLPLTGGHELLAPSPFPSCPPIFGAIGSKTKTLKKEDLI